MRLQIAPGIFADADPEFLQAHEERLAANPLLGYFPYPHQERYHAAETPIKALIAGNQSGKTHSSLADDLIQLLDEEALPEWLRPFKRWQAPIIVWVGAPKVAKIFDTLLPKLRELCPRSQLKGGSLDAAFSAQHKTIDFANGSQVVFKTYDQDVDAYSGASIHRMHWDEEPEGEHGLALRHEARIRLLKHNGDECLSMTPLFGISWVHDHIWERRGEQQITVVNADMDDNLSLSEDSKAETLAMYTDEERKARKSGQFVHFRGLVYGEFSDTQHVIDTPPIKHIRGLDTIVAIDPGIRTTAATFNAFDGDNSMLTYDELYLHDQDAIPENAAMHIKAKLAAWRVDPLYYIIDPSARNRNLVTGQNVQDAYTRAGIPVTPGQAEPEAGVFEVKRRLQHKPTLYHVARNCVKTIWEFGRYRMDDKADGKFKVVKEHDHALDTIRYCAMAHPLPVIVEPSTPQTAQWIPGTAPSMDEINSFPGDTSSPPLGSMT